MERQQGGACAGGAARVRTWCCTGEGAFLGDSRPRPAGPALLARPHLDMTRACEEGDVVRVCVHGYMKRYKKRPHRKAGVAGAVRT